MPENITCESHSNYKGETCAILTNITIPPTVILRSRSSCARIYLTCV